MINEDYPKTMKNEEKTIERGSFIGAQTICLKPRPCGFHIVTKPFFFWERSRFSTVFDNKNFEKRNQFKGVSSSAVVTRKG